jgi:primosomal protein N' (replication factor Y) (superfamily II helicase)
MSVVNGSGGSDPVESDQGGRDRAGLPPAPLHESSREVGWFEVAREPVPEDGSFAGVVFNRPLEQVWTYRVPKRLERLIQPGQRVRVPLGRGERPVVGYCVRVDREPPAALDSKQIKDVVELLDSPPLIDQKMLEMTHWMADYYACSWGQALDAVVPAGVKKHSGTRIGTFLVVPEETRDALRAHSIEPRLTAKQEAVLEVLCRGNEPLTVADVCRLAHCTAVPIHALKHRGLLHTVRKRLPVGLKTVSSASGRSPVGAPQSFSADAQAFAAGTEPVRDRQGRAAGHSLVLTGEQTEALAKIAQAIDGGGFAPFLIHGVTGSGKTEIYLKAIEQVVARGQEAIVLVPEISLTPQTIQRFSERFDKVAVLHSHLSDAERHRYWQSIASGLVQVVVGVRSAIFAPARRLGLIVVDEEHESTFKQETVPRYHARDVAVKRAQMEGIPVLLGSATPSLETWQNTERGRYTKLVLPARVGGRPMPDVEIIDLRNVKTPLGGLSEPLRQAMLSALDAGGQIILLLNRRGFHTFVLCPRCGAVVKCEECDVASTYHRGRHILLCHTCDAERACPPACPSCRAPGLYYGGIGTERLEKEIHAAFPDIVARRMDADTMRAPGSHHRVLESFKNGEVQILLGTQMIAKGLDFPNVTLVGVVSADTALHLPDFRAAERTFQLVAQVAGRTGRGEKPGRVIVQTFSPDHPAIRSAAHHDYHEFVHNELPVREIHGVPPYGRLVRLIARGPVEATVSSYMNALAGAFRSASPESVRILGPAPAPVLKIRSLYRYHLQLRCPNSRPLQALAKAVPGQNPAPHGVELAIDVDPISLL